MSCKGRTSYPASKVDYSDIVHQLEDDLTSGFGHFMVQYESHFDIRKITKIRPVEF